MVNNKDKFKLQRFLNTGKWVEHPFWKNKPVSGAERKRKKKSNAKLAAEAGRQAVMIGLANGISIKEQKKRRKYYEKTKNSKRMRKLRKPNPTFDPWG